MIRIDMICQDTRHPYHHRKRVPQSQRYYEKKRAEGKRHNQAIRSVLLERRELLGRRRE